MSSLVSLLASYLAAVVEIPAVVIPVIVALVLAALDAIAALNKNKGAGKRDIMFVVSQVIIRRL